ncbi:hypothetical protein QUF76_19520, partial [Desulfobacterales bacterium HSG16]|nr:hypothetical protein [Desulfobacterales bacterium HSG16]
DDYNEAVKIHDEKGDDLGDILIRKKLVTEEIYLEALTWKKYTKKLWSVIRHSFQESSFLWAIVKALKR